MNTLAYPRLQRALNVLLATFAMISVDFLLHAGLLARLYLRAGPFLLGPEKAFSLIPLGYAGLLLLAISLSWLTPHFGVRGFIQGFLFGLRFGALLWGALVLGLASISTAPLGLLVGWFVGQVLELAIAGGVMGSALAGRSIKSLTVRVALLFIGALLLTLALQALGLAPALKVVSQG